MISLIPKRIQPVFSADSSNATAHPLCIFGVISDVHYADADDSTNYEQTRMRHFRRSVKLVETAVAEWAANTNSIDFILQLGDLIDGRNADVNASGEALRVVQEQFAKFSNPIYHILGNHELYNFSRSQILQHSWLNPTSSCHAGVITPLPGLTAYYHVSPANGFRLVILDEYEFSMLGREEDDEIYRYTYIHMYTHTHTHGNTMTAASNINLSSVL